MRRIHIFFCSALLILGLGSTSVMAQDTNNVSDLQKQLHDQFVLTKVTSDRKEITTAGSVLALKVAGLQMVDVADGIATMNVYKGGAITQSSGREFGRLMVNLTRASEAGIPSSKQRKFAVGETFWITAADATQDGVVLMLVSDPIDDIRYYCKLKFPFKKNAMPPAAELLKAITEVLTVNAPPPPEPVAEQPAPPPAPPIQEIAPPPPPPAPPKTISIGQTKAVVVATWGQPTQIIKGATKEVYVYPDMKVVFVAGKVADVK